MPYFDCHSLVTHVRCEFCYKIKLVWENSREMPVPSFEKTTTLVELLLPLESKFWEPLLVLKKMTGHTLQRGEGETMIIKQWNENSVAR